MDTGVDTIKAIVEAFLMIWAALQESIRLVRAFAPA
jgi:hypothetical protein